MSEPSELLLFGSFTEEETKFWLDYTSANELKPVITNESKDNISKLNHELTFGSFTVKVVSPNEPITSVKDNTHPGVKPVEQTFPIVTANGKVPDSNRSYKNGKSPINVINFHQSPVSDNGTETAKEPSSNRPDSNGVKSNGAVNNSLIEARDEVAVSHWKTDGPVLPPLDILPRGLMNSGNLCFLNSTLQAVLSCTPFVQLLQGLRYRNIPKVGYPTLTAFAEFIGELDVPSGAHVKKKDSTFLEIGKSFSPAMFEVVLRNFTPDVTSGISGRNRQEDAQEFLNFILDQMHDELLKFEGQSNINGSNPYLVSSEDEDWVTVGTKKRSAVTRTQSFVPSELSAIFGGQLRSVVKAKGIKSSATVQPFFVLHLDISHEAIHTIEDALHSFSASETLEEYKASSYGKGVIVTAQKSVQIQSLPKILILHLMRFGYGKNGSKKLLKPIKFPLELLLSSDLLVSPSSEGQKYELVSTITHHGKEASNGHYTADVSYPNGHWLRFDDASVTAIEKGKVLHDQAYVLFYKQSLLMQ